MAKLAIGTDGSGGFLKITDNAHDPRTEPDTNYENFRFNSRFGEIGYFDNLLTDSAANNYTTTTYDFCVYTVSNPVSYTYPSMCDFYLTNSSGWNFSNWWRSINRTVGSSGGNEWGSVAYVIALPNYSPPSLSLRSTQGLLNGYSCTFVSSDLPADNVTPLPFASGGSSAGKRIIDINHDNVRVARAGYDVRTATDEQLIIGGSAKTMPVYMARRITIGTGQTTSIPLPSWVPSGAIVLMQWNIVNQVRRLPSIWVGNTGTGENKEIAWRIVSGTLQIHNYAPYNYDVVFFVVSQQVIDPAGGPAIKEGFEDGEEFIRIVQGNGIVAADSRWSYLPIIKSGVLNFGSGQHSVSTTFPNQGYIPFVWYSYAFDDTVTIDSVSETYRRYIGPRHITNRYNATDYLTNTATISQSSVVFTNTSNSPYELAWLRNGAGSTYTSTPRYIRYYIFAIPDVQS